MMRKSQESVYADVTLILMSTDLMLTMKLEEAVCCFSLIHLNRKLSYWTSNAFQDSELLVEDDDGVDVSFDDNDEVILEINDAWRDS
jgi:hypothetical protein